MTPVDTHTPVAGPDPALDHLPTPYLVVDHDVLSANITRLHRHLAGVGLAVRPHVKTHKVLEIAALQVAAGASGLTVATVGEAEVFADAGYADLVIAYPLWVDEGRARRLRQLASQARIAIGVDSVEAAERLTGLLDPRVELMVEVDSGHHRTGCRPGEAGAVAAAARAGGLTVRGVFSFPGHSYAPDAAAGAAAQEEEALRVAAESLRAVGVLPEVVSGGSTPSAAEMGAGVLTEARPGVYVVNDAQQWELGRCAREDVALTAYGRVVSSRPGRVVLDTGSKVLGGDRSGYATGYGRLLDHPEARIVQLSEHHAVVALPEGPHRPPLGALLRVVPNHVCVAVNLVDHLRVVQRGHPPRTWSVAARGAHT